MSWISIVRAAAIKEKVTVVNIKNVDEVKARISG